ncbi:MAG TPA: GNAT family N-acetyltransferase [Candidatus Limnocylindrales bacterium]|nr:GNAT family N-acetyltransferase [Candidatus Limnocylindrales bacterium]
MRIERARPADEPAIEALLLGAGLPGDGLAAAFEHGVVARDGDAIIGAAAVELYGEAGLLRSVVVDAGHRGEGLGRELVAGAEAVARAAGVRDLYLLTETAGDWFPRLGYEPVDREVARDLVGDSVEFRVACATTALAMRRRLT